MRERHLGDHVTAEPIDAALLGERVDDGRILARVDRAAHQRHRQRNVRIVLRLHAGDSGKHRHGGLAHANDVRLAAERVQHRDHVIDVVVEVEAPVRKRHHAGIDPLGDVDVMVRQERLDRAAQQRRVVARHRRDDEQFRLRAPRRMLHRALEMQEPAERPLPHRRDVHRHALAADQGGVDAPFGLAVAARGALEEFERCGRGLPARGVRERVGGVLVEHAAGVRECARGRQGRLTHLVEPVHRRREERTTVAGQCGCPAEFTNWHVLWPRPQFLHCSRLS